MTAKMTNGRLILAFASVLVLLAPGCDDSQERIDKTIEEIEEHYPEGILLKRLRAATPESLKTPDLLYARLVEQKRTVSLLVRWIENEPTVDAIMISRKASGYTTSQPIEEAYMSDNREAVERGFVLFNDCLGWEPGSDEWAALKKEIDGGGCEVVLMRDGQPASNSVPLEYIAGPTLTEAATQPG